MGDVYKAMNRSKQERAQASEPAGSVAREDNGPAASPSGAPADQRGALPIDHVSATARPLAQQGQGDQDEEELITVFDVDDNGGGEEGGDRSALKAPPVRSKSDEHDQRVEKEDEQALIDLGDTDRPKPRTRRARSKARLNGYSGDVVVHHDRGSVIAEQYRAIRLQVLSRGRNRKVQTHVITSSSPQEGKTVTTINLGMAFSELSDSRTLILECDLRRPSFPEQFRRECRPGLFHLLRGDEGVDLDDVIYPTAYDNLQFLPAGDRCTSSTEMLQSHRMTEVLERLKQRYDHILLDSPPTIHVTDACILGSMCDDVLLVVQLNKTPLEVVDRAKRLLRASHCEIAGMVLTHQQHTIPNYLYQYV